MPIPKPSFCSSQVLFKSFHFSNLLFPTHHFTSVIPVMFLLLFFYLPSCFILQPAKMNIPIRITLSPQCIPLPGHFSPMVRHHIISQDSQHIFLFLAPIFQSPAQIIMFTFLAAFVSQAIVIPHLLLLQQRTLLISLLLYFTFAISQ